MSKVIGIDLGTGNSCVAVMEGGRATVIANAEGKRTTPSVIYIKDSDREVGDVAKRKLVMNPKNTVSFIKRFMGAKFADPDVQKMLTRISYEVIDENSKPRVKITNTDGTSKLYSPEEISSFILALMKKTAEDYYGEEVTKAVITCPAWFNDAQRQATKVAGELAGLEVLRIINEPTAAILASDIKLNKDQDKTVAVVDLGCGTLDISVCDISVVDGTTMVEILSSHGNVFLGGENFDNAIVKWVIDEFKKQYGADLSKDPMAYARVITAAEKAKCELSSASSTDINEPYITQVDGQPAHLTMTLTRAKYEQLTADLVQEVVDCTAKAFEKAGKTANEIDEILLVGGMTRSLNVQEGLTKAFGLPLDKSANPDEIVALGAVTQANIIAGGEGVKDIQLLDVTPLSVGIETEGEIMTVLIPANTTIPTTQKQTFTTAVDNQPGVFIKVLQGERQFSRDNKTIGTFQLDGIAPARRGVPQIEVSFDIDANGILKVSAKDLGTGKEQHITITNSDGLTPEEIERIKADAEKFKEEDAKRKAEVDKLNAAEGYAYQIRNTMDEENFKDKFTEEQKKTLNEKIDVVLAAAKDKDVEKAEAAKKELEDVFNPIIQEIYKQAAPQGGANPEAGPMDADMFSQMFNGAQAQAGGASHGEATSQAPDGDTTDVPFEEVK